MAEPQIPSSTALDESDDLPTVVRGKFGSNTRHNFHMEGSTSFYPSRDFIWGFMADAENAGDIIREGEALAAELGITFDQCADFLDELFVFEGDEFRDCFVHRWHFIHSPICPFGDFCTKAIFDTASVVTEIWLINPEFVREVIVVLKGCGGRHPTPELKRMVDAGWILIFSDLHPHLLRTHHFCQGKSSPYHIDLRMMQKML